MKWGIGDFEDPDRSASGVLGRAFGISKIPIVALAEYREGISKIPIVALAEYREGISKFPIVALAEYREGIRH